MTNLKGKKLLVLGGVYQHCKLVEAAKELGVITYVTDYLPVEQAPAKQMADKYFMHNISDIDGIAQMCREEGIDGVIATSLDACQRPYQKICEKLGLPCFGTGEQYHILTDKNAFKEQCRKSGLDTIPQYTTEDFRDEATCVQRVSFPILVKPCHSRGSRGQTICDTYESALEAIDFAQKESGNQGVVIEKYMGQHNDFSMTLIVVNGKAHPFRTVDRILGTYEDGLDKVAVGSISPSVFTELYVTKVQEKVARFIRDLGLVNAPVFMQGFVDGNTVRFYDPGLRYPGGEFERMFKAACGKDMFYPLIEFALTGAVSEDSVELSPDDIWLSHKTASQILPALCPGKIVGIEGMEEIRKHPNVVGVFPRYSVGDVITATHNVNQRFCEIAVVCNSPEEMRNTVEWIYRVLKVTDSNGNNMIISKCPLDRFFLKNG